MQIMAKAAETPVEEYKGVFDGIKIFNMDESISEFEKRDDYSSLFYTGNETVKFLKSLKMMDSDPDLDKALDGQFLKEIKAEKK
jgi:NitT/TauT family transport system substrate-binding protein